MPPGIDLDTFRPLDVRAARRHAARDRPRQPAEELPAHRRGLARGSSRARSCGCSASSPSSAPGLDARYIGAPERRGRERAAQPGHGVRADLATRGLLPAAAGGDGRRRAGGLHRRPRQPRLLPRRGELPAGGRPSPRRWPPASSACCATRRCAPGSWPGGLETVREYAWERRIDQLEAFFNGVADERPRHSGALPGRRVASAARAPPRSAAPRGRSTRRPARRRATSDADRDEQPGGAAHRLGGARRAGVDQPVAHLLEQRGDRVAHHHLARCLAGHDLDRVQDRRA